MHGHMLIYSLKKHILLLQSAAKRYRITGTGRVVVRHAGKNHFQEKKSSKRRQKLSGKHLVSETHLDLVKGCLPYAKVK
jgi:large subunit ribosomal protein L35